MMTREGWKALPNWACWKSIDGRKVPIAPRTGKAAKINDPATWSTAAEAWAAKKRYNCGGLNYAITVEAGIVGIDLDDCFEMRDGRPRLKSYAFQIVQMLNTYTERSPSGRGLHLFAVGSIVHNIHRPGEGFEMYAERHFMTVTGNQYGQAAVDMGFASGGIEERTKELMALFVAFDGDVEPQPRPARRDFTPTTSERDVMDALRYIPARGSYHDWITTLMAIHAAFPDERGVAIAESWSPGKRGEVAAKFRSFDESPDGITVASLFHRAKQYGYQMERPAPARPAKKSSADITDALARRVSNAR